MDILELTEQEELLRFHHHTLRLYSAVCALGNHRVAHALCSHVDEPQLLYAIESKYMPGLLRAGYYDLLIDIHLSAYATARLMMNSEFIVPMTEETKSITLFPDAHKEHGLPGIGLSTSLRPRMRFSSPSFVRVNHDCYQDSPEFPLDTLKAKTMQMLTEAVREGGLRARDPVGGTTEFLFVPLIKLFYTLLIMGVFHGEDLKHILQLIEPRVFTEATPEAECQARPGEPHADDARPEGVRGDAAEGLLQMKLPEPVKLQVSGAGGGVGGAGPRHHHPLVRMCACVTVVALSIKVTDVALCFGTRQSNFLTLEMELINFPIGSVDYLVKDKFSIFV